MSSIHDLINLIKSELDEKLTTPSNSEVEEDSRPPILNIFSKSIQKTMREIKEGSPSEDFPDLVVINFIIEAAVDGYSPIEIKDFVDQLYDTVDYEVEAEDEV